MKLSLYTILSILLLLFFTHISVTFKDWSNYREYIIKELEKMYDAKIHIGGKIKVSLITSKLTIYNTYIQYNKDKEQKLSNLINIRKIEIKPSLSSLFSFSLQPKSILFLDMKCNKENLLNIINTKTNNTIKIIIKDSQISFNSDIFHIKKVSIKRNKQFFGEVQINDNNYDFSGKINTTENNIYVNINSNFANLLFKGNRNKEELYGNLILTINNNSNYISNLAKIINLNFLSYIIPNENIKISSNININKNQFTVTDLKLDSKSIQGTGSIQNDRKSDHTNINISLSKIDLKNYSYKSIDIKGFLESFKKIIPKSLSLDLDIKSSNIEYYNKISDKFHAMLKFANEEIKVDVLLQFPGTDNISHLSGKVSNNSNFSEFNGDFLIKNKSLIPSIFPSIRTKKNEKNKFKVTSKLYFAPRILSLSDIKLITDKEESLQGSIKVNYTKKHNIIGGKFNICNLNMNKYDFFSSFSKFQLLKNLKYDVNIKTSIKNSILNDTKIEDLDFLLRIEKNKLTIDKIKIFGENFDITGSAKILVDQKYTKPLLDINLTGNKFDGNILKLPNLAEIKRNSKNEINQIQWSTKSLNFLSDKKDFDANIQIKTTEFKVKQNILKDFYLDTVIRNNTITIRQISSNILENGKIFFQGYLKADAMHTKLSIINLDIKELIGKVLNNINGQISLNGEIKSQGKSFHEWANNLSGNLNLQAQKIHLKNVDFNSFITKLVNSKNKHEISKLTYVDIYNNSTFLKNISGKISINSGVCSTSSQFSIDQASGSISSNLILSNFSLASIFRLFFIPQNSSTPLYIEAQLDGPIWCPKMSFDVDQIYTTLISKKNS